jgi:hypothetical protein
MPADATADGLGYRTCQCVRPGAAMRGVAMAGKLVQTVRRHGQRGMTTAEYAVGSVAVATGVGVLITLVQQPWFGDLIKKLIEMILDIIMGLLGAK